MAKLLKTDLARWKVIVRAIHESVDQLAIPTDNGNIEIAASALEVILFLLEFHPRVLVRKRYIEAIQQLLAGEQIPWTPEQLSAMRVLTVSENPRPEQEVWNEVFDILFKYGEYLEKNKPKNVGPRRDVNNRDQEK